MSVDYHTRALRAGFTCGIPVIPPGATVDPLSKISPQALGKVPGYLNGDGTWHGFNFTNPTLWTRTTSAAHRLDLSGASLGFACGTEVVGVDVDITDPVLSRSMMAYLAQKGFPAMFVRYGERPKFLLAYRGMDGPILSWDVIAEDRRGFRQGVQLIGRGKQFVVHGTHPKTRTPYVWPERDPLIEGRDRLPLLTPTGAEQLRQCVIQFFKDQGLTLRKAGTASAKNPVSPDVLVAPDKELVKTLVRAMPNLDAEWPGREEYVEMAYAIRGALGVVDENSPNYGLGETLWLDWCKRWDAGANDPQEAADDYARANNPAHVGWGYLVAKAAKLGLDPEGILGISWAGLDFVDGPVDPVLMDLQRTVETEEREKREQRAQGKQEKQKLFDSAFHSGDVVAAGPILDAVWLLKNLAPVAGLGVIYGAPKTGKTFVALDMACRLACGVSWYGHAVKRSGWVLYVASEGGMRNAKNRVLTWVREKQDPASPLLDRLVVLPDRLQIGAGASEDAIELIRWVREEEKRRGEPCVSVFIDTLNKNMVGDENSTVDMTAFLNACDEVWRRLGTFLWIVHHSGKDEARGARGSSALLGSAEAEIEIVRDKDAGLSEPGMIALRNLRHAEDGKKYGFVLRVVKIGVDADLDDVTSVVVDECAAPAVRPSLGGAFGPAGGRGASIGKWERRAMDAVPTLEEASPFAWFSRKDLLAEMKSRNLAKLYEGKVHERRVVDDERVIDRLIEKGLLFASAVDPDQLSSNKL